MRMNLTVLILILISFLIASLPRTQAAEMLPGIQTYLSARAQEFNQIPAARRDLLNQLVQKMQTQQQSHPPVQLVFICTHNSRRSHFGQVWSAAAAAYYHVEGIRTFSGGTEATACNIRTMDALRRAGLTVTMTDTMTEESQNPHYLVKYAKDLPPAVCYSKVYDDTANPQQDFIAILTCSDADTKCPVVIGARARFPVTYEDPKAADGTPEESAQYDARSRQIAREMMYVFSRITWTVPAESK